MNLGKDDKNKATVYNNIAFVYSAKGVYIKAIVYFQKAIELGDRVGDYREVAGRYLNLGNTYIKVKNYELAEKYLTEGIKRLQRVGLT